MSNAAILGVMIALFLGLGYAGVPVAFALMAGVLVGAAFTDVALPARHCGPSTTNVHTLNKHFDHELAHVDYVRGTLERHRGRGEYLV